ncbi:MAG: hypothetical protein ACOYXB_15670 [Bacteroidota bacterium]
MKIKKIARYLIPRKLRFFIWSLVPDIHRVNTLVLEVAEAPADFLRIPDNYSLAEVGLSDETKLRKFFDFSGPGAYERKVPVRLRSGQCKALAFIDSSSGDIAYLNWIHHKYDRFLREFGIDTLEPYIFWDSALCLPEHRHKGLHERMEQELMRYTFEHGVKRFYMQIHVSNKKGNAYAAAKGYRLVSARYAISWPVFNIYRDFYSFLKNPFKSVFEKAKNG